MSFVLPKDPETSESLQCLACAGLLEIGNKFNVDDLRQLMMQGNFGNTAHSDNAKVWDMVRISRTGELNLAAWANDPSDEKLLNNWLDSSVAIANSLEGDNKFKGSGYVFFRQDQFPAGNFKDFKDVFVQILKSIRQSAQQPDAKKWFQGSSAKIYSELQMKDDKWNPADIIAVKSGKISKWENKIGNFITTQGKRGSSRSTLSDDLEAFALSQRKLPGKSETKAKVEIMLGMEDLYEYNKQITTGITSGEFIPVSLKIANTPNPAVDFIKVAEPSDVSKYFKLKVIPGDFIYDAKNQLATCPFKIDGLPGSDGGYTFTVRNFAKTAVMGNLDVELKKDGAGAQAGKIAFSITSKITKLSAGRRSFSTLNKKRKELWRKYTPPGLQSPTKGVFWKHTVSKTHSFTNWKVFDTLHREHTKQMNLKKSSKRKLDREQLGFERRIDEQGRLKRASKTQAQIEDPTGVLNDIKMWAEYADWLSDGETTMQEFMKEALGNRQWEGVKQSERKKGKVYDINLSFTQAKYMKNKIQAYEQAWIIDPQSKNNPLTMKVRNIILKSMWMYAASKGFVIFNKNNVVSYLLSGSHLKCAA